MEIKQTEQAIRELRRRFSKTIARELLQWENELQKLLPLPIEPSDEPIYLEYLAVDRVLFQLPKDSYPDYASVMIVPGIDKKWKDYLSLQIKLKPRENRTPEQIRNLLTEKLQN